MEIRLPSTINLGSQDTLVFLLVGLLAGILAGRFVGHSGGVLVDMIVGVIGAFLGRWMLGLFGITIGEGLVAQIITAFVGAVVLMALARTLAGGFQSRKT